MDSTSVSLLRRLREPGQNSAWKRFVDLYAPLIFHWSVDQGLSRADAADLLQDVLSILVVKLPEFEYDPDRRFRGWLRTMTINRIRDFYRRNAAKPAVTGEQSLQSLAMQPDSSLFEQREYQSFLVNRALELMRSEFHEKTWQACWQLVVDGLSAANVAENLGMTVNSVYLAKSRVLKCLRQELDGLLD